MSKSEDTTAAARAILQSVHRAAVTSGREGFGIIAVNVRPGDPIKGNLPAILIAWTAGPVWGELKLEFKRLPMHVIPAGKPCGHWIRVNGTAVTPAGLPIMPKLSALLSDIANAAANRADMELPMGAHYCAAAE